MIKTEIEEAADENRRELEGRDGSLEGATGPPRPWNREIQRALRVFCVHFMQVGAISLKREAEPASRREASRPAF
jgi:hypothetical protein